MNDKPGSGVRISMLQQESRKHHFVPAFLLRAWAIDDELNGYWWDRRRQALACKVQGPKAFCHAFHLLSLEAHPGGRDVLEKDYFASIDSSGADVRSRILEDGPESLTGQGQISLAGS